MSDGLKHYCTINIALAISRIFLRRRFGGGTLFPKLILAAELRQWVRLSGGATATGEIIWQSYEGGGEIIWQSYEGAGEMDGRCLTDRLAGSQRSPEGGPQAPILTGKHAKMVQG